jgi:hypothetical protein
MSLEDYHAMKALRKEGAYDEWRHRTEVSNKITFLLDHCSPEEQKHYLKEFSTEDLTRFLLSDLYNLSEKECTRLCELKVSYSSIPGLNSLLMSKSMLNLFQIISADFFKLEDRQRLILKSHLESKLKELEWRKLDSIIASSQ